LGLAATNTVLVHRRAARTSAKAENYSSHLSGQALASGSKVRWEIKEKRQPPNSCGPFGSSGFHFIKKNK
jgi:hypothetical protein